MLSSRLPPAANGDVEVASTGEEVAGTSAAYCEQRSALLARGDVAGARRRRLLADLTDTWLAGLFDAAAPGQGVALAAVGGLGRRDLAPEGDLDLLLLHEPGCDIQDAAAGVWYPVWDSGVPLDHAVRTLAETRAVARSDVRVLLGLLDLRHLAGDADLTARVRSSVLADYRAAAFVRLPQVFGHARQRAVRVGLLASMLQPDVKEAAGGLRDLQVLRAVAASWLAPVPWATVEGPRERLLDVRDALHLVTGREVSRLDHQEQDEVAKRLGYADSDALLRDVSAAGRTIRHVVGVAARQVGRAVSARDRHRSGRAGSPARWQPLGPGVVERDGEVGFGPRGSGTDETLAGLRVAAAAARAGLPLAPAAVQSLARAPVPAVPWPDQARDLLVRLLGAGEGLVDVWETLDESGYLIRLLPEWEPVRGLPQHHPIHRHTVDRHSIEVVVRACALLRRVHRPDLLLLAALCHDLGKGVPGAAGDAAHAESGVGPARALCRRVGLGERDTDVVASLVRHHLLLATTATRRDPSDPLTVTSVRDAVENPDTLDLLHALTEADARATGPATWSGWRAACVGELVARVHAAFCGVVAAQAPVLWVGPDHEALLRDGRVHVHARPGPYGTTLTVIAPDRPGLLATVAALLFCHRQSVRSAQARSFGSGALMVWETTVDGDLPADPSRLSAALQADLERAFAGTDVVSRVDARARLAQQRPAGSLGGVPPQVRVAADASSRATVLEVRADDAPGLLHRAARQLAALDLDVVAARASTFGSQVVDVFFVVGPDGEPLGAERAGVVAARLEQRLGEGPVTSGPSAPPDQASAGGRSGSRLP